MKKRMTFCSIMIVSIFSIFFQGCSDSTPPEPPSPSVGSGGALYSVQSTTLVEVSPGDFRQLPANFCDFIRTCYGDDQWYHDMIAEGVSLRDKYGNPVPLPGVYGEMEVLSSDDQVDFPDLRNEERNLWNQKPYGSIFYWGNVTKRAGTMSSKIRGPDNLIKITGFTNWRGNLSGNFSIGDPNASVDDKTYIPNPTWLLAGDWTRQKPEDWIASRIKVKFSLNVMSGEFSDTRYILFQKFSGQRDVRLVNSGSVVAGFTTTYSRDVTTAASTAASSALSSSNMFEPNNTSIVAFIANQISKDYATAVSVEDEGLEIQKSEKRTPGRTYKIIGGKKSLESESLKTFESGSGSGFEIVDRSILRLDYVYDSNLGEYVLGWVPVTEEDGLNILINDPNHLNEPNMGLAERLGIDGYPYVFELQVQSAVPLHIGLKARMELQVFDGNNIVNVMPIDVNLVELTSPTTGIALSSYWYPCYYKKLQGKVTDILNDEWTLIHMSEGNRIRLSWQNPFGDFNHDKVVNLFDLWELSGSWLGNPGDPCNPVNLEFIDWTKPNPLVDFGEYALFANDWRFKDPNLSNLRIYTGDYNNDGICDIYDLLILASEWLEGPAVPFGHIDTTHDDSPFVNFYEFGILADGWMSEPKN